MSGYNGGSTLKRSKTTRSPGKFNNRPGLYSLNQKELKTELKRIDLSKRQYESFFSHEQRKLITRFATKLIRSSSTLDIILNNDSSAPSSPVQASNLKRGASNLGFTHKPDEIDLKPRPITSMKSSLKLNEKEEINNVQLEASSNGKTKKNVRWNSDLFNKEDSIESSEYTPISINKNRTTMYEVNKKYDELKLKLPDPQPKILLPQLISLNRRSTTEFVNLKRNPLLSPEAKNSRSEHKEKFLNNLNREDSGFYSYKECLGYDNFRYLLKSAANNPPKIKEGDAEPTSLNPVEKFKNPFNHIDIKPPSRAVNIPKVNQENKPLENPGSNLGRRPSASHLSRRNTIGSADSQQSQTNIRKKKEEDEKLCVDTFKAQNIRSLTFKQITTY